MDLIGAIFGCLGPLKQYSQSCNCRKRAHSTTEPFGFENPADCLYYMGKKHACCAGIAAEVDEYRKRQADAAEVTMARDAEILKRLEASGYTPGGGGAPADGTLAFPLCKFAHVPLGCCAVQGVFCC